MIWLGLVILTALCALALAPAFFGKVEVESDAEVAEYIAQIDALDGDSSPEAEVARTSLTRRILARRENTTSPSPVAGLLSLAVIGLAGFALYSVTGTPRSPAPIPSAANDMAELLTQLERRLATDRADDPAGWLIYARTLRSLGRATDARAAFDRALALQNDPRVEAERDRTPAPAPATPGPTADDIAAANAMSEGDRQAMIQGMVDGLSARLEDAPNDPAAWVRLIRARLVLGQREEATVEVARLREALASEPETVRDILAQAEWSDAE